MPVLQVWWCCELRQTIKATLEIMNTIVDLSLHEWWAELCVGGVEGDSDAAPHTSEN